MWVEDGPSSDQWNRDIVVHGSDDRTHTIRYDYGCYDPLQYPILFPRGETGWHPNIPRNTLGSSNLFGSVQRNSKNNSVNIEELLQAQVFLFIFFHFPYSSFLIFSYS